MNEISKQMAEIINLLSDKGGILIEKYAEWCFVSGLGWSIFGAILIAFGLLYKLEKTIDDKGVVFILKVVLVFAGCVFVFSNLPDIFASEGIAAHRLILDIKK